MMIILLANNHHPLGPIFLHKSLPPALGQQSQGTSTSLTEWMEEYKGHKQHKGPLPGNKKFGKWLRKVETAYLPASDGPAAA